MLPTSNQNASDKSIFEQPSDPPPNPTPFLNPQKLQSRNFKKEKKFSAAWAKKIFIQLGHPWKWIPVFLSYIFHPRFSSSTWFVFGLGRAKKSKWRWFFIEFSSDFPRKNNNFHFWLRLSMGMKLSLAFPPHPPSNDITLISRLKWGKTPGNVISLARFLFYGGNVEAVEDKHYSGKCN